MSLNLKIVSPEKVVYEGAVERVVVPGTSGEFEILVNHAPIISTLEKGKLVYQDSEGQHELMVNGVDTPLPLLRSMLPNVGDHTAPNVVALVFAAVVETVDALVWGKVRQAGEDGLPTFYTAVSGFRMLLALATLVVCYFVVGRDAMMEYCLVFIGYYFAIMTHHSVFFARISNSHTSCDNENK